MQNVYQKYVPNMQGLSPQDAKQAMQNQQSMQGVTPELLKEQAQDTYVGNRVSQMADINPIHQLAVGIPIWYGIAQLMDKFAAKCRGNYEDTIEYKITNAGDRFTNFVKDSSLGKSSFGQSVNNGVKTFKEFVNTKIIQKSALLRAVTGTPSLPEMEMVKGQANGMQGIQLFDYPQVVDNFVSPLKYVEDLDCYGADKSFIDKIKVDYHAATTKEAKAAVLQNAEFELLGKNSGVSLSEFKAKPAEARTLLLKDLKAKAYGYRDFAHWEGIKKNIQNHVSDVIEACHNADTKMYSKIWSHDNNAIGKVQGHLFGRKVYATEFRNKLLAELGNVKPDSELAQMLKRTGLDKNLPKSNLGKFFGKYVNLITEGLTNRVAGGKLVAVIQAWFLAEAVIRAAKAEKGDKVSTLAERLTELVAFFAAMPLALKLMHGIGGLQYAGMTPEQVAKYREDLKVFNEKVKSGFFKDKSSYKAERQVLKETLKGGNHNIFTRFAKRIGRIVTVGLEQVRPYSKHAVESGLMGKVKDIFRNPKYWFKQGAGYPVRIVLGLAVLLPPISKLFIKGSHLIFGRPKNSTLDEDKPEPKEENKPKELTLAEKKAQVNQLEQLVNQVKTSGQPLTTQEQAQLQLLEQAVAQAKSELQMEELKEQQVNGVNSADVPLGEPTNLLNKYKNLNSQSQEEKNIFKPQEPVRTYIPSPEPVKILEPERNYIPSPLPAQVSDSVDTTAADKAMQRADIAERMVMQTLAMK